MFERISRKVAPSTRNDGFSDSDEVSETGTFDLLSASDLLFDYESTCHEHHSIEQVQAVLVTLKLLLSCSSVRLQNP